MAIIYRIYDTGEDTWSDVLDSVEAEQQCDLLTTAGEGYLLFDMETFSKDDSWDDIDNWKLEDNPPWENN